MTFIGSPTFRHDQPDRIGVLLTNLGTPDAPTPSALRRYLKEFLWDPRVVEVPRPLWWLILNGVILNIRPRRSAKAYASVWTDQGSPLLLHTRAQTDALRNSLQQQHGDRIVVEFAMRYGNPPIAAGLQSLFDQGARKLLVLPLYPQYSAATSASTFDAVAQDFTRRRWLPELRFIDQYAGFAPYIDALAASIRRHWESHGRPQRLLFSYHGIPLRYLREGDPYFCQCHKTSRLVAERLGLDPGTYLTTFQSRFGREEWLQPYTDATLKALPAEGIDHVQVICPGFSADCLETLEEIGEENRHYFLAAGGRDYSYIPALNSEPDHIAALAQLVNQHLTGWLDGEADLALRRQRAGALGAGN
ncbi:MAG: ferrochelatase [Pseudomonadota bacterium]|nr:ferrochelatase [Pseudomonadota bacterium]